MNEGFTVDDIHMIREEDYEYTKNMSIAECFLDIIQKSCRLKHFFLIGSKVKGSALSFI